MKKKDLKNLKNLTGKHQNNEQKKWEGEKNKKENPAMALITKHKMKFPNSITIKHTILRNYQCNQLIENEKDKIP